MYVPREFFPATLRTADGRFLADGHARGYLGSRTLEFRSDFVPLLKYRTRARVARMKGGYELQRFEGTVYLSSPAMLRLVEVNERELAEVALENLQDVNLSGTVIQREAARERGCAANIYSISFDKLRFTSPEEFMEGERLGLRLDKPILIKGIELQVMERIAFGQRNKIGYRCDILEMPEDVRGSLVEYLIGQADVPPKQTEQEEHPPANFR